MHRAGSDPEFEIELVQAQQLAEQGRQAQQAFQAEQTRLADQLRDAQQAQQTQQTEQAPQAPALQAQQVASELTTKKESSSGLFSALVRTGLASLIAALMFSAWPSHSATPCCTFAYLPCPALLCASPALARPTSALHLPCPAHPVTCQIPCQIPCHMPVLVGGVKGEGPCAAWGGGGGCLWVG